MLHFYYNPISINARRVWVALLEKSLPFEPILVNLDGDQFGPEFTVTNPLQRVPVLVDDEVTIIESLAILDYLEAKYSTPSLIPSQPEAIAKMRMVEIITVVELQPETIPLTLPMVGLDVDLDRLASAQQRVATILQFLESLLDRSPYFIGEQFTLADIVAGTLVPSLPLDDYPYLRDWAQRLAQRESWQQTAYTQEDIEAALPNIRSILERRS